MSETVKSCENCQSYVFCNEIDISECGSELKNWMPSYLTLQSENNGLRESITTINNLCVAAYLGTHEQMRQAIEESMGLAEKALGEGDEGK